MSASLTLSSRFRRSWPLVRVLAAREFRLRYQQSAFEMVWSLITPVVVLAVYGLVLTQIFDVDGGGVPYLSLVWTGMVAWTMFSSAVGGGVYSLLGNAELVSKIYFPREVIPLAVAGTSLFDLLIGTAVLLPLVVVQMSGLSITAAAVVPAGVVLLVWTAAATVLVGVLAVFVRDVTHVTRLLLQVGFFATPVMYPANSLPAGFETLNRINPIAVVINAWRDALLHQVWPNWSLLGLHMAVGSALLVAVIAYTRSVEDRIADVI